MANKMLIDASHPEETRVAVVKGNRIEEFDFESEHRKQLKGNIYLARVTRVEPSLQAAFVEYGGNRHGFLAFSEIHPDYYQIPVADRLALLEAEAAAVREELDSDEEEADQRARGKSRKRRGRQRKENAESVDPLETVPAPEPVNMEQYLSEEDVAALAAMVSTIDDDVDTEPGDADEDVESVGAEDALEEVPNRRRTSRRNYKIQEVIKRRQILLVQVVKEERGNKGAALTTYLSLAGRYSVLMPNTARGGGISRKITNVQDRRRLKDIVKDLDVPQGMGVILRTAGANRTKPEIKRDYEYLMRLWDNVRNLTLESIAPTLVYEEGSLIKRSVRDLYNKEIGEVLVAGEDGYREAKDFMRMLMPSHAKSVQPYRDSTPLFAKYGIEGQLDKMLQPQVTLKSGGYIIINQTEALVAIDVNSGRSTREHSIEDTAFQTNLEAADEVARQLRLRDLAGLIVIDFIDMEEKRNNRNVEKRLKDALKNDRARIQVGRISHFGLLEMSRQRIRASVLESTMSNCPHCHGTGYIRSESSIALHVMRAIEEFLLNDSRNHITVNTPTTIALYILNNKREMLGEFEQRFGLTITIEADEEVGAQHFTISKGSAAPEPGTGISPLEYPDEPEDDEIASETGDDGSDENDEDGRNRKRRRRRRRRGNREKDGESNSANQSGDTKSGDEEESENAQLDEDDESTQSTKKKRRRGRRGGRRSRKDETGSNIEDVESADSTNTKEPDVVGVGSDKEPGRDHVSELEKSKSAKPKDRTKKTKVEMADDSQAADVEIPDTQTESSIRSDVKPDSEKKSTNRRKGATSEAPSEPVVTSSIPNGKEEDSSAPRKGGWWQKKGFF